MSSQTCYPPGQLGKTVYIAAVILLLLSSLRAHGAKRVDREFEKSARFLSNPQCGWIAYNQNDSYSKRKKLSGEEKPFPFASVIYTRHPRRAWEGTGESFQNSRPVKMLESWMQHGRHVAFRIFASHMSHLPDDVANSITAIGPGGTRIPYWDPDYISDHRKLITYLGDKWADSPHLAFVDIGGVGKEGRWFFSRRKTYESAGLTNARYAKLVKKYVRMYENAFPDVQLFISYKCVTEAGNRADKIMALLKEHGIGVRDDSLGEWPYPRNRPPLREWPVPLFWRDVPVLFEINDKKGGGIYGWEQQGNTPEEILEWTLRMSKPSYINLGGTAEASAKACRDMPGFLLSKSPLLGYRFVLQRISYPASVEAGGKLRLRASWSNRGRAPCYRSYEMEVSLWDEDGQRAAVMYAEPRSPTTEWQPLEEVTTRVEVEVPREIAKGTYTVKLRLIRDRSASPAVAVETATKGEDEKGRFSAGKLNLR